MPLKKKKHAPRRDSRELRARMKRRYDNLDASESLFFNRSLEQVKARAYEVQYPEFRARDLIPVATDVDPDVSVITYREYDQVGSAKVIAGYSDDLPRVDVFGRETQATVRDLGDSYGYNVSEIRKARREGSNLEQRKANAARRAIEQLIEDIAISGDSTYNLVGLNNVPNAQTYTVPNGAGGSATFALKTNDEILADLFGIGDTAVTNTRSKLKPNVLLLPQAQASLIARRRLDTNGTVTLLQYFLANSQHIKRIEVWDRLDGAGTGGVDRMIAYPLDPNVLELVIPREFEQLPGQPRNLEIVVPCLARTGGVLVYQPMGIVYGEGI